VIARATVLLIAALAASPVALAAGAWPMPGHDAANTSRSSVVGAQGPALVPGWPRAGLLGPVLAAPSGAVEAADEDGTAILNRDGTSRRRLPVGVVRAIGPDGRRYLGGTGSASAYTPAGVLIWRTPLFVGTSASYAALRLGPDGSVYLSGNTGVAAVDSSGAVRWRTPSFDADSPGALAVGADGTVYLGRVRNGTGLLMALRPDGRPLWQRPLGAPAVRVAVADDGTVITTEGPTGPQGGGAIEATAPGGAARWSLAAGRLVTGLAIGADGTVYLAEAQEGLMRAIAPDGTVRWTYRGRLTYGDPLVGGDGTVYVGGWPLVALRSDGSRAWAFPPTSRPLVPEAIGSDGTLFATAGPNLAGSALMALAGPSASARVRPPSPAGQRTLVAGLRVRPARFRMTGPVSLCPPRGGRCRPATPLGATLSFTVTRDSAVLVVVRSADGRTVTSRSWHTRRGTTWTGLWDAADYHVLPPGRYSVTVRAAAGSARATAAPARFTVLRG
jgi:outer membrane protein assembly factor BamB